MPRLTPARPCRRNVIAKAEGGFDLDKFVSDLPVPVEYAYAGVAWGAHFPTRAARLFLMRCDVVGLSILSLVIPACLRVCLWSSTLFIPDQKGLQVYARHISGTSLGQHSTCASPCYGHYVQTMG
jgi:hypothetical protein